jgi:competence protein ComEA
MPTEQPLLTAMPAARPHRAPEPEWWPDIGAPPDTGPSAPDPESLGPSPPRREPRESLDASSADSEELGASPFERESPGGGSTDRELLGATVPAAEPWWRRLLDRVDDRWLPVGDRSRRWLAVVAAVGAVLVGVAVAIGLVMSGSGGAREAPPALPAAASEGRPSGSSAPGGSIVVSVVGRVAKPGLVTLPQGARVADALEATGGPVPGVRLGGLNLARRLGDGEQIYVGVPTPANAEPAPGASAGRSAPGGPGGQVDLNSASLASLDTLPGVGPVTAQRILDWRTQHGRFATVDQLQEVDGIGPSRFAKLKELVVAQ